MRQHYTIETTIAEELAIRDARLARVMEQCGTITFPVYPDPFYSLVMSVVYQQLSFKGAETIFNRLIHAAGYPLEPQVLSEMMEEDFRGLGISRQKAGYIHDICRHFLANPDRFHTLHLQPDDEVIASLTEIKGIGLWSAQMFLMFTLIRPDVFPVGDLGIRKAMQRQFGLSSAAPLKEYSEYAERWSPYRSFACHFLWHSHDK
ncbi:MAG: DNA-3-methyladenine glycosylase 2 family protein [Cryomorphaceae bacterium]|nr:MAG: DNA-3-methyladenine glycosylase 2 family protein [Cryomorphaceae bacterium]